VLCRTVLAVTAAVPPPTVPGLTGLTVLARGGYATVYRAMQESVGREVAVKVENRTLENDRDQRRFLREARAAGRMSSHPHVVDLFDAGMTTNGHPYLIMELCDGSYAERMRSAPLSAAEAREVGFKIADALGDAHSLGVLHRDVKPANILFSRFGEPALADFGLAILAESRDVSITLDVLTPAYAPPEMFRHAPPSPSADVYALCATLYALIRGKPPRWREDQAPSLVSLVDMFAQQIPDLPGVPPDMMRLLRAGMANEEGARPTAPQLRDALQGLRLDPVPAALIPPLGSPPVEPVYLHDRPAAHEATVPHDETVPHGTPPPGTPPPGSSPSGSLLPGPPGPANPGSLGPSPGPGHPGPPPGPARPGPAHPGPAHPGPPRFGFAQTEPRGPMLPGPPAPHRRAVWVSLAAGAGLLGTLITLSLVYGRASPDVKVFHTPVAGAASSRASARTPSGAPSAEAVHCGPLAPAEARCLTRSECYDAASEPIGCGGTHTWEAFALADLPPNVKPADAAQNAQVKKVCSEFTLLAVDPSTAAEPWQIEVLTPAAGNRTYRCLAGKGRNALSGPRLRH
jgi:serine/threonine protein kinase